MPATSIIDRIYTRNGFATEPLAGLRVLHLGCGSRIFPGATGVDILPSADLVHDLERMPWPLESSSFDVIILHAVLEHLQPFLKVMEEVHRVGRPGARVIISVPYFRSTDSMHDPTHVHFFTSRSMDYVTRGTYNYTPVRFNEIGFWYGWPQRSRNPFVRWFKRFIHSHAHLYDQYLALVTPVKVLTWELEVLKP